MTSLQWRLRRIPPTVGGHAYEECDGASKWTRVLVINVKNFKKPQKLSQKRSKTNDRRALAYGSPQAFQMAERLSRTGPL